MVKVSIEIRGPNLAPELREFSQAKIVIGRETGHIVLADPQASSQHAEINVTPAHVTFVDLHSTNGSFLADGQRITQPLSLAVGSEVRIGSCAIILRAVQHVATGPRGTLVMPQTDGAVGTAPTGNTFASGAGNSAVGGPSALTPAPSAPIAAASVAVGTLSSTDGRAVVSSGMVDDPLAATHLAGSPQQQPPGAAVGAPSQGGAWQGPAPAASPQQQPIHYPAAQAPPPGFAAPQAPPPAGYQPPYAMGQPQPPLGQAGPPPNQAAPMWGGDPARAGGFHPGSAATGAAPPGQTPMGGGWPGGPGPSAGASGGSQAAGSDPIGFAKACIEAYSPHFAEATKVLGILAVPLGVLNAVSSYVPVVGWLLAILGGIGYAVAYFFFGYGAQAEYAMRLAAGTPISASVAWKVQLRRMFPWIFGLIVPLLGSMVLCLISVILWGLFVLPAYMIEGKTMFDANKRSFEIASKDWVLSIVPMLLVAVPAVILSTIVTVVLGFIPYVGEQLAAIWGPVFSAALTPLLSFVQFRVYFALRLKHEGIDATQVVRNQPL